MAHSTLPRFTRIDRLPDVPDAGLCYHVRPLPVCLANDLCTLDCANCETWDSPDRPFAGLFTDDDSTARLDAMTPRQSRIIRTGKLMTGRAS